METLLDNHLPVKKSKIYTLLSFVVSFITLSILIYSFLITNQAIIIHQNWKWLSRNVMAMVKYFAIAGVIFTVLSFLKKEPNTPLKWIGAALNVIFFVLIFGLVAFALWFKYYRR